MNTFKLIFKMITLSLDLASVSKNPGSMPGNQKDC